MQLRIQEIYKFDPPILEMRQKCCPVCKEGFIFFPKRMLPERKNALGYDISWDNVLTSIAHILRYFVVLTGVFCCSNCCSTVVLCCSYRSNGLVVKVLDSQSRGPVFKTTGWLQGRFNSSSFQGQ